MEISRISQLSGMHNTLDINVTEKQIDDYYEGDMLIQDAFPNISHEEREFIKSGITPQEWKTLFGQLLED